MTPTKSVLLFDSEKKHSVRYNSTDQKAALLSVYVTKATLPQPFPKSLIITIEDGPA